MENLESHQSQQKNGQYELQMQQRQGQVKPQMKHEGTGQIQDFVSSMPFAPMCDGIKDVWKQSDNWQNASDDNDSEGLHFEESWESWLDGRRSEADKLIYLVSILLIILGPPTQEIMLVLWAYHIHVM